MKRKKRSQRKDIKGNGGWSKVGWKIRTTINALKKSESALEDFNNKMAHILEVNRGTETADTLLKYHSLIKSHVVYGRKDYYIESKELLDFFLETEIKKDSIDNIRKVIMENGFFETVSFLHKEKKKIINAPSYVLNGAIHSKKFEMHESKLFYLCCMELDDKDQVVGIITDSEDFMYININNTHCDYSKEGKLLLNMLFYMDAFPECVLDTPPNDVFERSEGQPLTIGMSDTIKNYLHETRDVSPHLRRGHFRYLSSDRFKNKKGQCVFVKPSFVKGNAKTIIDGGNI